MQRDKQLSSAVTFKQARAQRNQLAERVEKLQKKAAHAKAGDRATILAELGEAQFELRAADQAVGHHERAAVERLDLSGALDGSDTLACAELTLPHRSRSC